MTETPAARLVACPRCKKSGRYDLKNPYRPFCSAVCKNEDIIAWAEEGYRIPDRAADEEDRPPPPPDGEES